MNYRVHVTVIHVSYDNNYYQVSDILNNVLGACELDGFTGEEGGLASYSVHQRKGKKKLTAEVHNLYKYNLILHYDCEISHFFVSWGVAFVWSECPPPDMVALVSL